MELLSGLLPDASLLHLETWHVDTISAQVTLWVQSTQTLVHCPACRYPTRRIPSRYRRTVADLPWAHCRVLLQLGVRNFSAPMGAVHATFLPSGCPASWSPWPGTQHASCNG
jgi:transposase